MENRQILIIEDDPAVARAAQRVLSNAGFDVTVAESGETGERALLGGQARIHTVLIDYTLPGANGIEVLGRLRNLYPHLRFVLMSGFPREDFMLDSADGDSVKFVQKPFMVDQLVSAINQTMTETASRVRG